MTRPGLIGLVLVALSLHAALAVEYRLETLTDKDSLGNPNPRSYTVRPFKDSNQQVLIADHANSCIYIYHPYYGTRTPYAGVCGQRGTTLGTMETSLLMNPLSFDTASGGRIVVADRRHVVLLSPSDSPQYLSSGDVYTHCIQVYENAVYFYNHLDGHFWRTDLTSAQPNTFTIAHFQHSYGLFVDEGKIWYTSWEERVVASIDIATKQQERLCGRGGVAGQQNGPCGTGSTDSKFTNPWGIVRANGEIFVAESTDDNPRIVVIRTNTQTGELYTTTFVFGGSGPDTLASGPLPQTLLGRAYGLSVSADKTKVFIAQLSFSDPIGAVRRLDIVAPPTPMPPVPPQPVPTYILMIRTLAKADDPYQGSTKRFLYGQQVQEINADEIVVADKDSNCIAKYTLSTGVLSEYDSVFCNDYDTPAGPVGLFARYDLSGKRYVSIGFVTSNVGVLTYEDTDLAYAYNMPTVTAIRYLDGMIYALSPNHRQIVRFNGTDYGSYAIVVRDTQIRNSFDISASGNIFATTFFGLIEKISAGGQKATFCGRYGRLHKDGACAGGEASFDLPWGIAVTPSEDIVYVGDHTSGSIRKIVAGQVTTLTQGGSSLADTFVSFAQTGSITHMSLSADGYRLYFSQANPQALRVIEVDGDNIATPVPPTPTPPEPITPLPPTAEPPTPLPPEPEPLTPVPHTPNPPEPPTPVPPTPEPFTPLPPQPEPLTPVPPTPEPPEPPTPVPPGPAPITPLPPQPEPLTPVPPTPSPPEPLTPVPPTPEPEEPCGGSCLQHVCFAGDTFDLLVEGATTPNVWGTGKYSDDSDVGSAAVHAGMVAAGERATLKIKCFGAVASFTGTTKNGVTSQDWSTSVPSFGFVGDETIGETPEPPSAPSRPDTCYADQCVGGRCNVAGKRFQMIVTGKTTGAAYGDEVYTDDSSVGLAAVHIGLLDAGETGIVEVQCVAGRSSYPGTTANGVTTTAYPFLWRFAFTLRNGPALPPPPANDACSTCLQSRCRDASKSAVITVRGSSYNRIWGDGVFSGDSDPNVAAVHAGLVQVGEEKIVKAQCRGSHGSFSGSIRNDVRSRVFNKPYDSSYELAAFDIEQASAMNCVGACLSGMCDLPAFTYKIRVTGNLNPYRLVWGYGSDDEPFTSDSDVHAAAAMSGLVAEGETADLQVLCTGPRDSFGCRAKNGVQSECYNQSWGSSFQITHRFGG